MIAALNKHPGLRGGLLVLPAAIFLIVFFLAPFFIVVGYSFAERGTYGGVIWNLNLENYQRTFDPLYFDSVIRSTYIAEM